MISLRPYQTPAVEKLIQWFGDSHPEEITTLVAPMAAGKTLMTCAAIDQFFEQGKRVWVIVNRVELLKQWTDELTSIAKNIKKHNIGKIAASCKKQYFLPVQIVQIQTLAQRLKTIPDAHKPDVIILDEAHETAFVRAANDIKKRWTNFKQINLTATPVRHGKAKVQYADLFPKSNWHIVTTAKELIAQGNWKRPIWKSASDDLAQLTERRFAGVREKGGDYDDTSQSTVMIDLLPYHIAEWQALGGDRRHCVFFCVNQDHAVATAKTLQEIGRRVGIITSDHTYVLHGDKIDEIPRADIVAQFRKGELTDLVNCECLTTGFDAPIASCAVWLRRTLSIGLFCQMAGRVLRKYDGITTGLLIDLAGNLGLHPFPEDIDWLDFDPCKRLFRDPHLVVCRHCNHRHDTIPAPIHPVFPKLKYLVRDGQFADGMDAKYNDPLKCHGCGSPVYGDLEQLTLYAQWLSEVRRAGASGKKQIPRYKYNTAGLSIGLPYETQDQIITVSDLYESGVWRITEGGTGDSIPTVQDRSEEWRQIVINTAKNLEGKELRDLRFSLLNQKQQDFLLGTNVAHLMTIANPEARYRVAIAFAYLKDEPPTWAYRFWGQSDKIPQNQVEQALKSIWGGSVETKKLLSQWLESKAKEAEENGKYPVKGVCDRFMTTLMQIA